MMAQHQNRKEIDGGLIEMATLKSGRPDCLSTQFIAKVLSFLLHFNAICISGLTAYMHQDLVARFMDFATL